MKIKIFTLAILSVVLGAMNVCAQSETDKNDKLYTSDGLFNHLSIGVHTGLAGSGIDVTMPVHRLVTVRTGYSGLHFGDIKFKSINTAEELAGYALVEDDAVHRAQMADKIELAAKPNFWNVFLLAEVHPFPNDSFHFTAGLYFGSKNFLHFRNTNDGALDFLYDANNKVLDYNRAFNTNFSPIGLKFGDYIFTADENGNIDVMMKTNVVKPYLGVGVGKHIAQQHRLSFALDLGLIFWGSPKFLLNNGKEIKSSGREAGITQVLSWLKAWPNLQLKVAYKIF
ncbi:MAG: hypothetical protein IJM58_06385 [Muribaculaceae bacterium]|nr:hypothetical protein [Muribaculaceae bacterium]